MFDGLKLVIFGFVICMPLAIWKIIDIIVWLFQHISITNM